MSAERRVARNTAWAVLQPLLMNVLSLAATGYIARKLGVVEFGLFNLGFALPAIVAPLVNLGLRTLTIRHVAANRERAGEYLGKVLVLRLILACIVALIAVPVIPLCVKSTLTRDVMWIATVWMVLTTLGGVLIDGFHAFEMMRPTSLANLVGGLLLTVSSVAALYFGGGIREMAWAYLLGPLCTLVLLWLWSRGKPFYPKLQWAPRAWWEMLRQGAPLFVIGLPDFFTARTDIVMLTPLLGEHGLGSFTAAINLVDRASVLADGAGTALLPAIVHLNAENPNVAAPLLRKVLLWLLMASLPVALGFTALSGLVVGVLYGPGYEAAAGLLAISIWRVPVMCLTALQNQALIAVNRHDIVLRAGIAGTVVFIALLWPLGHWLGPTGAAWAMLLRLLVTFVVAMGPMARRFPNLWPWRQLARVAAALALMSFPLAFVSHTGIHVESVALLLASVTLYGATLALMRVEPLPALLERGARALGARGPVLGGDGVPVEMVGSRQ